MALQTNASLSLIASVDGLSGKIDGLCARLDWNAQFIQRANDAIRQVPLARGMLISGGTGTIHCEPKGPPVGYFWSIRRFTAYGFSAGTAAAFIDTSDSTPTVGEPIEAWSAAGINTHGKGELIVHPGSSVILNATGITPSSGNFIYFWGAADQFETWLLPWYLGVQADG